MPVLELSAQDVAVLRRDRRVESGESPQNDDLVAERAAGVLARLAVAVDARVLASTAPAVPRVQRYLRVEPPHQDLKPYKSCLSTRSTERNKD